jgi:hypothetical protein
MKNKQSDINKITIQIPEGLLNFKLSPFITKYNKYADLIKNFEALCKLKIPVR